MAKVVVRFFDDETLEGVARDLDFDEPDFLVEVDDALSHLRALAPVSSR